MNKEASRYTAYLKQNKMPFEMITSGSTIKIKSNLGKALFLNSKLDFKDLLFIKNVYSHIKDKYQYGQLEHLNTELTTKDVNYVGVNKDNIGKNFKKIIELDIKSAYWNIAYQMGIIDKELYEKGLLVRKEIRLVSLGTLARQECKVNFDGEVFSLPELEQRETAFIFYSICKKVDEIILKCVDILRDDYIFFWVDAVYFKDSIESVKKVSEIIRLNNLNYNMNEVKIHWEKDKIIICDKRGKRPFYLN